VLESPILNSFGFTRDIAFMAVVFAIINLGLDYLFIPRMGISGAALGTMLSQVLIVIVRSFIVKRRTGINDFANYKWTLPSFLCLGTFFFESLQLRVFILIVVLFLSFLTIKKLSVFNREYPSIIDNIDMPPFFRRIVLKAYFLIS